MITIIHGEDIAASRKYFTDSKEKKQGGVVFDGTGVTVTDLTQVVDGGDLFQTEKTVFMENFLSKRKPGKEFEDIIALLNKTAFEIFLWEGKALTKKQLTYFPKAQIKGFSLPQTLFSFVDSITPNNANLIKQFHNAIENSEVELVFFMIIRQFRLLLALSETNLAVVIARSATNLARRGNLPGLEDPHVGRFGRPPHDDRGADSLQGEQIDEVKRLAPWQSGKLKKQAAYFSQEQLLSIYKKLYEIDLAQKTGALPYSLVQAIDFFLLGI